MTNRHQHHRQRTAIYFRWIGCLILACALPYTVRVLIADRAEEVRLLNSTVSFCVISTILGLWIQRSFSVFPGVDNSISIAFSYTIAFISIMMMLFAFRWEYSRWMLFFSYAICVVFHYFSERWVSRSKIITAGAIPHGQSRESTPLPGVHMILLPDDLEGNPQVDIVVADLQSDMPDAWERRLADFAIRGIPVLHYKHLKESLTGRVELEHLSENHFGQLAPISAYMTFRHVLDWVTALTVLILAMPLLLIVAILVKLDSPGPALFRQTRIGYRGKPFTVVKFRTMKMAIDGQDELQSAKTQTDDNRITKLGHFLRKSRIDELPQVLNILTGEMSWIGPRPEAEVLSRWYEKDIPFYRYRHIVRPGITGWAQVCQGHVTELEEVRYKLYYDFFFIKYYSFWLDLVIVFRTIKTMLTGHGAR